MRHNITLEKTYLIISNSCMISIKSSKMIFLMVLIGFLLLSNIVYIASASSTHDLQWSKTYGGSKDDVANCIAPTLDGGYILAGYTESHGNGSSDVYLVKTDADGNMQWYKNYGGKGEQSAYSVSQMVDNGYIITGYTTSYGNGGSDVWLLKTDTNGNLLWNKSFEGSQNDLGYWVNQTSDGGYIITGFTYSFGINGSSDVYLIKTDANGNLLWNKTYGGGDKDEAHMVRQTSDGGYIITGLTKSYGNRGGDYLTNGAEDFWLLKTDANGNELWNKTYGGKDYDIGYAVAQTPDGGYAIAGATKSFGQGGLDAYLVKTDANGTLQWNQTYGGPQDDEAFSMALTPDGGYILTGTTYSSTPNYGKVMVIKTDANGTMQWNGAYGGNKDDFGYSIVPASDGGYLIAGYTTSYGNGGSDALLLKIGGNPAAPTPTPVSTSELTPSVSAAARSSNLIWAIPTLAIICVLIIGALYWKKIAK